MTYTPEQVRKFIKEARESAFPREELDVALALDMLDDYAVTLERPTRTVWIAWHNTDLTEGRGSLVPFAICGLESTARRVGKGKDVQGCDCRVTPFECPSVGGHFLAPFRLVDATREDRIVEDRLTRAREAVAKARAAGLSDEEIAAMRNVP